MLFWLFLFFIYLEDICKQIKIKKIASYPTDCNDEYHWILVTFIFILLFYDLHLSPVVLGHWFATHQTRFPNQDESSSCPPKHGSSWREGLTKKKLFFFFLQICLVKMQMREQWVYCISIPFMVTVFTILNHPQKFCLHFHRTSVQSPGLHQCHELIQS